MNREDRILEIEKRLERLPKGYISRKNINGREQLYLQWREGNKVHSQYIKKAEREKILSEVEERQRLRDELATIHEDVFKHDETPGEPAKGSPKYYLMWADEVIGEIFEDLSVRFIAQSKLQNGVSVIKEYTERDEWTREELLDFLQDRIVSPGRRDIEEILRKLDLVSYDVFKIALKTRAMSAQDLIWIALDRDERFNNVATDVFESVFIKRVDLKGDSVDTPEGQNIKRYGVSKGRYGIYKERLSPLTTDVESEIAVYRLAKRIGVPCCNCWQTDVNTMFSAFEYDFSKEYIVHFRRLIKKRRYRNDLKNLMSARPEYIDFFAKMIALDFITRQDDRHLSNLAVKIDDSGKEEIYPLYDNGRSLFYEDTEETVARACVDISGFATAFGPEGSYLDHVKQLSEMGISFTKLLDLDVDEGEIRTILDEAGLGGYRLDGSVRWIKGCIDILRSLK